ncbi:uncharacterized protein LOC143450466 [Clavelina lepadiformis]|uniref:uncharacterized protein LOC143450466 n=1 Tax=Clavelina lepadiformis TaxID=159417 RepID=UPI004040EB1F
MKILVTFALLGLIGYARCHSWIACSDYCEKNGGDWDPNCCRGFPRTANQFAQKNSFGQDRGYDFQPSANGPGCRNTYAQGGYSSQYPKAIYYEGQQVILAHPMKNHGADAACTNIHIPDNGNKIYRGLKDTDRDRSFSYYRQIEVADLGVSPVGSANTQSSKYPKLGYQNAPNFCKDTDKSMGTYSFNLPSDVTAGEYTFMWRWSFNGPSNNYATCFDVVVVRTKAERDNMLRQANPSVNLEVACGGTTSNGGQGTSVGCNGSPTPSTTPPTTTRSTTTRRTTTPRTTTTTTAGPPGTSRRVPVMAVQLTGDFDLGTPANRVSKRYVTVYFDCPATAQFVNARLVSNPDKFQYDLVQEQSEHIASRKIIYYVTYDEACNIGSNPPIATVMDEQ